MGNWVLKPNKKKLYMQVQKLRKARLNLMNWNGSEQMMSNQVP